MRLVTEIHDRDGIGAAVAEARRRDKTPWKKLEAMYGKSQRWLRVLMAAALEEKTGSSDLRTGQGD